MTLFLLQVVFKFATFSGQKTACHINSTVILSL